jgi:hypothetical protein
MKVILKDEKDKEEEQNIGKVTLPRKSEPSDVACERLGLVQVTAMDSGDAER